MLMSVLGDAIYTHNRDPLNYVMSILTCKEYWEDMQVRVLVRSPALGVEQVVLPHLYLMLGSRGSSSLHSLGWDQAVPFSHFRLCVTGGIHNPRSSANACNNQVNVFSLDN